jgi:hypothetical protein
MIRTINFVHRSPRNRDKPLSPLMVGLACAIYCPVALGIEAIDHGFLLFAWFMAGLLGISIYLVLDRNKSLANPYTLFFAGVTAASVGGYVYTNFMI